MARAGRKRKQVARQPNGQPSRARAIVPQQAAEVVVLRQPHRLGNTDQRCATVFGRFCLHNKLIGELYDAGEEYGAVVRRWRSAKGIANPYSNERRPAGRGPTDDQVRKWGSRILTMDGAMRDVTENGFFAVRQLVLEQYELGMDQDGPAITALVALAVHLGMIDPHAHPFACGR